MPKAVRFQKNPHARIGVFKKIRIALRRENLPHTTYESAGNFV